MELSLSAKQGRVCFQIAIVLSILVSSARGQIPLVDSTFHPDLSSDGYVNAMVVQTNGNIVVGGSFDSVSDQPITNLTRLHTDGTLDESFPTGTDGEVLGLALQPDGKIIVGGSFTKLQGVPCVGLGRLLPDGQVDGNFNPDISFDGGNSPYNVAIRPDGRILVSTIANPGGRLFQLTTNGALDATFTQTNGFEGYNIRKILVLTNGDSIVVGGFNSVNGFASPGWVVLDSSGNLRTNVRSALALQSDVFTIVQQTNGGFLIGGLLKHTNETSDTVLDRLDSNFQPDTNFHTAVFTYLEPVGPYIRSAILQPDGKIVVGGSFDQVGGYFRRGIVRLDSSGNVDGCFDPGIGLSGNFWGANVITAQPDGRILAGGSFTVPGYIPNNLVRFLPQSECDAIRLYVIPEGGDFEIGGTFPPGGTNYLQSSTNLTDWMNVSVDTNSLLAAPPVDITSPPAFFRGKKIY